MAFFWGIKEEEFSELAPEYFAALTRSPACNGYIWGEIQKPVLSDPSGNTEIGSGKCGVLASGWRSKEQYERDVGVERVKKAWEAMDKAVEKKDTWGTTLRVTENTGHRHRWDAPLGLKDRSGWLPAPGLL